MTEFKYEYEAERGGWRPHFYRERGGYCESCGNLPMRLNQNGTRVHYLAEEVWEEPLNIQEDDPETILEEAERIVNGPRRQEYGGCLESFERIAAMWSAYVGVALTGEDVAMLMVLLKVCRAKQGQHRDSLVDIAGYTRCVTLMQEERG